MTDWTDVTPTTAGYKGVVRGGRLYAGNRDVYAGALTLRMNGDDIDFYAGYIGLAAITWTDVSPTSTTWNDV